MTKRTIAIIVCIVLIVDACVAVVPLTWLAVEVSSCAIFKSTESLWLSDIAQEMGTKATHRALQERVTTILESQIGNSRQDVHEALRNNVPNIQVRPAASGRDEEFVNWEIRPLAFECVFADMWHLQYDSQDRLSLVSIVESASLPL